MRRRSVLATLGAGAAGALAGCNSDGSVPAGASETATAAPVPTDEPTPDAGPPPDLSALGVDDAAELGERHWRTLSAEPHGFTREATVLDDGERIRRLRVTVRATVGASAYHFTFAAEDTDRYPSSPVEPYLELWDDGTTYQRFGREEPAYAVTDERSFDAPSVRTTERYRVQSLFEAFSSAAIDATANGFEVVGTALRPGYDVTPRRLRLLERPRGARLVAAVGESPLFVERYEVSTAAEVSDRSVDVEERVDYERLDGAPAPPAWVETAREEAN